MKPLDISEFMLKWNTLYPFDRWWRQKHGIAFGSRQHCEASFLDMVFEYREDMYYTKASRRPDVDFTDEEKAEFALPEDAPIKPVKMTQEQIDDEYANLDLTQFNTTDNG